MMTPQGDNFQRWRDRKEFAKNRRNTVRSEKAVSGYKTYLYKSVTRPAYRRREEMRMMIDELNEWMNTTIATTATRLV